MLRVHEGMLFSDFDTPPPLEGLGIDLTPQSIKDQLASAGMVAENVGSALGASAAGLVIIIGSSFIPKEFKWAPYLRLAGIVAGATLAIGGAAYAFKKPEEGSIPGVPNACESGEMFLTVEPGWKILGTPRVDLTVANRTGQALSLVINGQEFVGTAPNQSSLEMTWNPESLEVPANSSAQKSFYFVTDKIKATPGPRTVAFKVSDQTSGKVYMICTKTVNLS